MGSFAEEQSAGHAHSRFRAVAKGIIKAIVFGVLAAEAVILIGGSWIVIRGECSLPETVAVIRGALAEPDRPEFSLRTSEAGLDLWNTPQGNIWTVHGDQMLPSLMSEQQRDIYEP